MSRLPHMHRGPLIGSWTHTTSAGEELLVVRGWRTRPRTPPKPKYGARWYVQRLRGDLAATLAGPLIGNPDGYRSLREVREHIAAAATDVANGYDTRWYR